MSASAPRPSSRALTALVQATNPHTTKAARTDEPDVARGKEEMLEDLVDVARKTLASYYSSHSSIDADRVMDRLKRRLARQPAGAAAVQELDGLVHRLQHLPNPPSELAQILSCLSRLALSAPSTSSTRSSLAPLPASTLDARPRTTSTGSSVASLTRPDTAASHRRYQNTTTVKSRSPSIAESADAGHTVTPTVEHRLASVDLNKGATAGRRQETDVGVQNPSKEEERDGGQDLTARAPDTIVDERPRLLSPIDAKELGIGTEPKSVVLERWRNAMQVAHMPERELIRDTLFVLQGINGQYVRFELAVNPPLHDPGVIASRSSAEQETVVKVKIVEKQGTGKIPVPTRRLLHRLAEAGKHYQRITSFVRDQATRENTGRIMQSLCHFLDRELEDYYDLICQLEALYNEGPAEPRADEGEAASSTRSMRSLPTQPVKGLTLKKIAVQIEPSMLRMRLMSSLVEGAQHAHGGALVSLIHSYTFNGDPLIRDFTERLLDEVSRSFFSSLAKWIYEGELVDPFKEFFVELNPNAPSSNPGYATALDPFGSTEEIDAAALWENKFSFRSDLVPTFLSEAFARKIFSAGKRVNLIRPSCGITDWQEARSAIFETNRGVLAEADEPLATSPTAASAPVLQYRDLAGLERTIDVVHSTISKRLLDIFLDKFKLQDHLRAINDYLLLTRGDFAEVLMESLSPILHKQASMLYRHSLSGALETAIRGSNAQYDDTDILRRLDARVLEFSGSETGWETFTLEYRVDSPVNTVLDASAMAEYQQVFQHLWRMKRVEGSLSGSCVKLMGASNALSRAAFAGVKGKKRREVPVDEDIDALRHEAHRSLLVLASMTHFIRQLQGYNQLEVISYSWQDLETFFEKRHGDLDVLIAAHRSYLSSLHGKVLLRGGGGAGSKQRGASDYLASELRSNFDAILRFSQAVDQLSTFILDFLQRRELLRPVRGQDDYGEADEERRAEEDEDDAATTRRLSAVLRSLSDASADFRERTDGIISRLERHGNLVIRDLSVRLDFNGFYSRTRSDRTGPLAGTTARTTESK